jgi:hypothetical protein
VDDAVIAGLLHRIAVIAGLDPAIHPLQRILTKKMDTRVI